MGAKYAAKNPAAMAALYVTDSVLVSPAGPIVRGQNSLVAYYAKRGAYGHAIKIIEVHARITQDDQGGGRLQLLTDLQPLLLQECVHRTLSSLFSLCRLTPNSIHRLSTTGASSRRAQARRFMPL
jgi:hypothetical protein